MSELCKLLLIQTEYLAAAAPHEIVKHREAVVVKTPKENCVFVSEISANCS